MKLFKLQTMFRDFFGAKPCDLNLCVWHAVFGEKRRTTQSEDNAKHLET